jgi:hypothetical protein
LPLAFDRSAAFGYFFAMSTIESEAAMNAAMIREIMTGEQLKNQLEEQREANSARIAEDYKGCKSKGDLLHLAEIPQREFFRLTQWLGDGWWNDRDTLRHIQKTNPHLFSHRA